MGQMKIQPLIHLVDNTVIQFVENAPQLTELNDELDRLSEELDFAEYKQQVRFLLGRYFRDQIFELLDWEYISMHWWTNRTNWKFERDEYLGRL